MRVLGKGLNSRYKYKIIYMCVFNIMFNPKEFIKASLDNGISNAKNRQLYFTLTIQMFEHFFLNSYTITQHRRIKVVFRWLWSPIGHLLISHWQFRPTQRTHWQLVEVAMSSKADSDMMKVDIDGSLRGGIGVGMPETYGDFIQIGSLARRVS